MKLVLLGREFEVAIRIRRPACGGLGRGLLRILGDGLLDWRIWFWGLLFGYLGVMVP